jgi:glycosyltransferase involved in cell wall biosynthesis
LTSTPGSCPITSNKVLSIGQGVNPDLFPQIPFEELDLQKLVHFGRFDKSKNIDQIIYEVNRMWHLNSQISLKIIGTPENRESKLWADEIKTDWEGAVNAGWLTFAPAVVRKEIPQIMRENGVFIHAFLGSLDKTLIESTMLGVPVICSNKEYMDIFGSWSTSGSKSSLKVEYEALMKYSDAEVAIELNRRRECAIENHSIDQWINKLIRELE